MSKDQVFLGINAKVSKREIRQVVTELELRMMDKLSGKSYGNLAPAKIKTLNDLFESKNLPDIYEKGDTPLYAGDNPLEEGRNYQFRWEKIRENCYSFKLEAKLGETNRKLIESDLKQAGDTIRRYFKEKRIKSEKVLMINA